MGEERPTVTRLTELRDEVDSFVASNRHAGWTELAERSDEEDVLGPEAVAYTYPVAECLMRADSRCAPGRLPDRPRP